MKAASISRAATASTLSVRDRLLEAAKTMFSTHGYDNTSTASLARLAGTSESQLMKHFGSKGGLRKTVFEEAWQRLTRDSLRAFEGIVSPAARFGIMVDLLLNALEEDERLRRLLLLEGGRIRREGETVAFIRGFLDLVNLIDKLLFEMRAGGHLRPSVNLQAVRSALIGALEGMLRDQYLSQTTDYYPAHYTRRQMRETFDLILVAFAPPPI